MRTRALIGLVVATVLTVVLGLASVGGTWAAFTDTGSADSGTFSAATLNGPVNVVCTSGVLANGGLTWTPPTGPPPQGYRIDYTASNGATGSISLGPGTTSWRPAPGYFEIGITYTVVVNSTYGTNWATPATTPINVRVTSIIFINLFFTCL